MKLPIFDNRTIVGYASSMKQAERYLKNILDIHPKMTLMVSMRSDLQKELCNTGDGFVYSVSYRYNKTS